MSFRIVFFLLALGPWASSGCLDLGHEQTRTSQTPKTPVDPWEKHTRGLPFTFGFTQGIDKALETEKPVMFFFTTTDCGYCKKLAKESFTDPDIQGLLERFVLVIVDCNDEKQQLYADKLEVQGLPFIIFKSHQGETLAMSHGYKPKNEFRDILVQALNGVEHAERLKSKEGASTDPPGAG